MKVFISWSGAASRAVAELLRTYLPCMIQDLRPFVSSHDLSSGARWSAQLSKELDESVFGIICLTPENLQSDWILFEAGALTKHVEGRACCLLLRHLGPADVTGPLAQFQNRQFNESEFGKLLKDINSSLPSPLADSSLQLIFKKWWPDIASDIHDALEKAGHVTAPERRDPASIMEELLLRVRSIQKQVEVNPPRRALDPRMEPKSETGDTVKFTVIFRKLSSDISDAKFELDDSMTFQRFLDYLYTQILFGVVPEASYGALWILRDVETGGLVIHSRMRANGNIESGIRDLRKITAVGIRTQSTLEAVRLADLDFASTLRGVSSGES